MPRSKSWARKGQVHRHLHHIVEHRNRSATPVRQVVRFRTTFRSLCRMPENDDPPGASAEKAKQQLAETLHEMVEPFITPLLAKAAEVLVSKGGERALDALQAPKKVFVKFLESNLKTDTTSVNLKAVNSSLNEVYLNLL